MKGPQRRLMKSFSLVRMSCVFLQNCYFATKAVIVDSKQKEFYFYFNNIFEDVVEFYE